MRQRGGSQVPPRGVPGPPRGVPGPPRGVPGPPLGGTQSGTPPARTEGVLTTRRAVCLLRSRRRTFLLVEDFAYHPNLIS